MKAFKLNHITFQILIPDIPLLKTNSLSSFYARIFFLKAPFPKKGFKYQRFVADDYLKPQLNLIFVPTFSQSNRNNNITYISRESRKNHFCKKLNHSNRRLMRKQIR